MSRAREREDDHTVAGSWWLDTWANASTRARRLVEQALPDPEWGAVLPDVQLVVSELTTNAVLHGRPPIRLRILTRERVVRVEISDGAAAVPVRSPVAVDGMTGRGLALVAAAARQWGVKTTEQGKISWAEVGAGSPSAPAAAAVATPPAAPRPDHYSVTLGDVPTDLLLAAKCHIDSLLREFALATGGAASGASAALPPRLADLLDVVTTRFAAPREAIKRQALAAAAAGAARTRLNLSLPLSAADAGEEYLAALEEIEGYTRAARLLTVESPPQHVAFRRWYVKALVDQLRAIGAGRVPPPAPTFEQYLLGTLDVVVAAQRTAQRAAQLQKVTAALAEATTPEQVAAVVVSEGVTALGASGGGLLIPEDLHRVTVPCSVGYGDELISQLLRESLDDQLPAVDALRSRRSVWLESREERDLRYPALAAIEPSAVSMCCLPLLVADRVLGALRFSFDHPRLFGTDERAFVQSLATQTALALERARLFTAERRARERSTFLTSATDLLASSLDPRHVLEHLVGLLVPRYADWAAAWQAEPTGMMTSAAPSPDDPQAGDHGLAGPLIAGGWIGGVNMSGGAVRTEAGDALAVPLSVGGQAVGMIVVACAAGAAYSADEQGLVEDLAQRAAVAVGNAQRYEREREIALTLQRGLLPRRLPQIPGLTFAWRYLPGSAGALVGGDWYDVLALDDGRVALVIGDVMGHGIEAAATMGQLRATARAHASSRRGPAAVLAELDTALSRLEQGRMTTAAMALLDPSDYRLTLASAGHLPPLLVPPHDTPRYLQVEPGPPLGVGLPEYPEIDEIEMTLEPGSTLLFFTDGLVEDRASPVDDGMYLLRLHARAGRSAERLCDDALATLGRVGSHEDDVALLAVALDADRR